MASYSANFKAALQVIMQDSVNQFKLGRGELNWNLMAPNLPTVCYGNIHTIAAAGTVTLDLADGTMKQPDGSAAVFTKVRCIWIINYTDEATVTAILSAGGAADPLAWFSTSRVIGGPSAAELKGDPFSSAGLAVAASADQLKLSAAGATVTAGVVMAGT